jgi:hypothetical protein
MSRRRFLLTCLAGLVASVSLTAGASAGGWQGDQIHADSFGNLVVQSPSGYKRIVVGRGYLAADLAEAASAEREPRVVYYDDDGYRPERAYRDDCNRQPVLLHGRSYMYGLDDNVVPVPAGLCR